MSRGWQPYFPMNPERTLLLVDGLAVAYRAFHAIPPLSTKSGEPTNALMGFIKMLRQLDDQWKPSHRAVMWDGGAPAERTTLLPTYKANRSPMPEALLRQLPLMDEYLELAGWSALRREDQEADDLLASFAVQAADAEWSVLIASSDKDLLQLVGPCVRVVSPVKAGQIFDGDAVEAKTGVRPSQVAEWLALVGDTADNIPGVPGVGEKTAARLLAQFGTLEAMWAHLADVPSDSLREKLAQHRETVARNLRMMKLPAGPVDLPPLESLAARSPQTLALQAFLAQKELRGLAALYEPAPLELF